MCVTRGWWTTSSVPKTSTSSFTWQPKLTSVSSSLFGQFLWTAFVVSALVLKLFYPLLPLCAVRGFLWIPVHFPAGQRWRDQSSAGSGPSGPTPATALHLHQHRWGVRSQSAWGQWIDWCCCFELLFVFMDQAVTLMFVPYRCLMRAAQWGPPIRTLLLKLLQSIWSDHTGTSTR